MFLPRTRDLLPGIGQVTKPAGVQTLISQPPIEAFHVAVLHRSSRLNVDQLDLPLLAPAQEMPRGELRSVVTANRFWQPSLFDRLFQGAAHSRTRQTRIYLQG